MLVLVLVLAAALVACGGFSGSEVDASPTRPADDATAARQDPPVSPTAAVDASADAGLSRTQSFPSSEEPKPRVACGENGEACTKAGEACCGSETWELSTCEPTCPRPLKLACDDPSDCARGSVCCGKLFAQRREVESSTCRVASCEKDELALCVRHDQCASGTCAMARPQFLSRCE